MRLVILDGIRYLLNCSQDYFQSVLPVVKADIQNMLDTQNGEQKWFNRKDKWRITYRYGQIDVVIGKPEERKGRKLKIEELRTNYYPVPVYELNHYINGALLKFWINLSMSWDNPAAIINSDNTYRDLAVVPYSKIKQNTEVFPLRRIGEDNNADTDTNYDNSTDDLDRDWSPGLSGDTVLSILNRIRSDTWNGPNLADTYWINDGWCADVCPSTVCRDSYGDYSVNHAYDHIGAVAGGPFPNVQLYFYSFDVTAGRNHEIIDCDTLETVLLEVADYSYLHFEYLPTQRSAAGETANQSTAVTLNGNIIVEGTSFTTTVAYREWSKIITGAGGVDNFISTVIGNYSGRDVYSYTCSATIGIDGWEDYEAWCIGFVEYDYSNNVQQEIRTDNFSLFGDLTDAETEAINSFVYSLVMRYKVKIADCDEEFILYEYTTADFLHEGYASGYITTEIYDFNHEPVYIAAFYRNWPDPDMVKYAMIYRSKMYISEEFIDGDIYNSLTKWSAIGYYWARACGVVVTTEPVIETEETN